MIQNMYQARTICGNGSSRDNHFESFSHHCALKTLFQINNLDDHRSRHNFFLGHASVHTLLKLPVVWEPCQLDEMGKFTVMG